ncbi:uncharacterized protein [Spinacia oleracea]|uniref:Reverse transcriptase domain-containing protein n=1 Tax=Spinacia oleracea TaxID=3562 RepID=A0ABM3QZ79_SPIOL|nr:uncharacterized protein LOC130463546 [Spinacia oleracea]
MKLVDCCYILSDFRHSATNFWTMTPLKQVRCSCGFPVAKRTAWTHETSRRKFVACKFYNPETGQRGCDKFDWVDEGILDWKRDVTNVLVVKKHRVSTDLAIMRNRMACIEQEKARLAEEVERLKKNKGMMKVHDKEDVWVEGQDQVAKVIMESLLDVFNPIVDNNLNEEIDLTLRQLALPCLSSGDKDALDKEFSESEIKEAMLSIHSSKSPGPDGVTAEFFSLYWETVGDLVTKSVLRFFHTGYLLKEWNQSLLVMIPKNSNPELASHFRPIGLCNTIYKCISKCMVNRLKKVLPSLISNYQHTFIPGRYMEDNVLLSHELLHMVNSRKADMAVIKVDMSKAYDRVDWTFLLKVLHAYGFSAKWIQLISQCVSTVSFRTLINRKASSPFKPRCGLRQGDPISPYLFLFCMDILSRMLSLAEDIKLFKGLQISRRSPSISHLFFADDVMLFFKADERACSAVMKNLVRFGKISGQQLNLNKSFVKFSPSTSTEKKTSLRAILKMPQVSQLGNHLGVPIDIQGKKSSHFQFVVDKIAGKILSWSTLYLSQSTKLILIQTILLSISSHVMKCLKVPPSITNKIDSLIGRFWWAGAKDRGVHWVKRSLVNKPKAMGGVGIRSSELLNDSLLFKQAMRLHKDHNLLVSKVIFSTSGCCVCKKGLQRRTKIRCSLGRRGLYNASSIFEKGLAWKIGNGKDVLAASMAWVEGRIPMVRSNQLLARSRRWKVEDFIHQHSNTWNVSLIRQCFEWKDAKDILAMDLPHTPATDFIFWKGYPSGNFTVRSGYAMLVEKRIMEEDRISEDVLKALRIIWKINILPKWKVFMWKLMYGGLAVNHNLERRGFDVSNHCGYCGCEDESLHHVFQTCSVARLVWSVYRIQVHSNDNESISFTTWIQRHILLYYSKDSAENTKLEAFVAMLRSLWVTRNGRVDGSWAKKTKKAGWGWAYKDGAEDNNCYRDGGGSYGRTSTAFQAEVKACLHAMQWVKEQNINEVMLLTDSNNLVMNLKLNKDGIVVQAIWDINEIKRLAATFNTCIILKADRDRVKSAHNIANRCRKEGLSFRNRL